MGYANDEFKGRSLSTFPILSRHACEILREPYHHVYRGAFIDYHLMDIFKRLKKAGYNRLCYLPDVVFEHLHYRTGKGSIDETYTARGRFDDDMLFVALAPVRAASVVLLVNKIKGAPAHLESLPPYQAIGKPANLLWAIILFTRIFLMDHGLPMGWRIFLWWWFSARYLASRVLNMQAAGMSDRRNVLRSGP